MAIQEKWEWSGGLPVIVYSDLFEWSGGLPYVIHKEAAAPPPTADTMMMQTTLG